MQDFENSIETGFQIATLRGPLCAEPVEGLAYCVETIECDAERVANEQGKWENGRLSDRYLKLTLLWESSAKPGPAIDRVTDFGESRRLSCWFIGLESTLEVGNVHV